MTELLSSYRNYDSYRRAYNECSNFKIPILGVHLKDLISLYEGMPDYLENKKINIYKLYSLYNHINELIQLQEMPLPLEANMDLVHLLTVSLLDEINTSILNIISYTSQTTKQRIPLIINTQYCKLFFFFSLRKYTIIKEEKKLVILIYLAARGEVAVQQYASNYFCKGRKCLFL